MKTHLLTFSAIALLSANCDMVNEPKPTLAPMVSDVEVSDIRFHDAALSAVITGLTEDVTCGFELSKKGSSDKKEIIRVPEDGTIRYCASGLDEDTEFCTKAFVDNGNGMRLYSKQKTFRTEALPGPEYIIPFEDKEFKKWIVARYDIDSDGEISYEEAQKIDRIETKTDNIHSAKGIEYFTNLQFLSLAGTMDGDWIRNGKLTELDISNNIHLRYLSVDGNQIKMIDLSGLTELTTVGIGRNPFEELDFSSLKNATLISCSFTDIKKCDLTGLDKLEELHLDGNHYLESVILDNKKLTYIDFSGSNLKSLDVSKCPILNILCTVRNNELEAIYVSRKQALGTLVKEEHTEIRYVD